MWKFAGWCFAVRSELHPQRGVKINLRWLRTQKHKTFLQRHATCEKQTLLWDINQIDLVSIDMKAQHTVYMVNDVLTYYSAPTFKFILESHPQPSKEQILSRITQRYFCIVTVQVKFQELIQAACWATSRHCVITSISLLPKAHLNVTQKKLMTNFYLEIHHLSDMAVKSMKAKKKTLAQYFSLM